MQLVTLLGERGEWGWWSLKLTIYTTWILNQSSTHCIFCLLFFFPFAKMCTNSSRPIAANPRQHERSRQALEKLTHFLSLPISDNFLTSNIITRAMDWTCRRRFSGEGFGIRRRVRVFFFDFDLFQGGWWGGEWIVIDRREIADGKVRCGGKFSAINYC